MSSGNGTPPSGGGVQQGSPGQGAQQGSRGRNRGGSGGRGGRARANHNNRSAPKPQTKKFTGKEEGLGEEYVYQHTSGREATDEYATTTEEIIRYSSTKYTHGADVERSLSDGILFVVAMPPTPKAAAKGADEDAVGEATAQMMMWKMKATIVLSRTNTLETNMQSVYALIKGQCSKPVLEKVESQETYADTHKSRDPIGLLAIIKGVMFNYNSRKDRAVTLMDIIQPNVVSQTRYMTVSEYLEKFRTQLDVLESAGGDICNHPGMVQDEVTKLVGTGTPSAAERQEASKNARNRFEAIMFLLRSNQAKYGRLIQELANDFNKGRDSYPETLSEAYDMMLHDVRDQDMRMHQGNSGMAFNTVGDRSASAAGVPATNTQPNPRPDITCHNCGKCGHFSGKCKEVTHVNGTTLTVVADTNDDGTVASSGTGTQSGAAPPPSEVTLTVLGEIVEETIDGFQFVNNGEVVEGNVHGQPSSAVPKYWILLDNQSTVDVFANKDLLQNIRRAPHTCRISCNAGTVTTSLIGDLPGYPAPVWYNPNGIANILSLKRVAEHCRVSYDSCDGDGCFRITKDDGSVRTFHPSTNGLHYCDTRSLGTDETVLINTVAKNKTSYTVRSYKQATLARRLQDIIGRPSDRDYTKILSAPWIQDCPVNRSDSKAALHIFGANLGSIRGKTVRRKGSHVPSLVADVPYHIIKLHRDVVLCFDLMYVNKIAFLVTTSRKIRFGTTERVLTRHADVIGKALLTVIAFYRLRGFRVTECHGDGEFEVLRAAVADVKVSLNVTSESEHVPEIERYLRTVKERSRAVYNTLPFKRIPAMMIVEMVHLSNFWLNMFPANDGVSATQSPRMIMTGRGCEYKIHCQVQFGEYAQVHESHDNSMLSRTTGAIALRPTGNIQGGHFFMSLTTGKRLNRYDWTLLPLPGEVIERVHRLARRNPAGGDMQFGWRDGTPIEDAIDDLDDLHDEDYESDSDDDNSDSDDDGSYAPDPHHPGAGVEEYDDGQAPFDFDYPAANHEASDDDEDINDADDANDAEADNNVVSDTEAPDVDHEYDSDDDDDGPGDLPDLKDPDSSDDEDSDDEDDDDDDDDDDGLAETEGVPSRQTEGVATEGVPPEATVGVPTAGVPTAGVPTVRAPRRSSRQKPTRTAPWRNRADAGRVGSGKSKAPPTNEHHVLNIMLCEELYGDGGFSDLEQVALTQYNLRKGLLKFGRAATEAVAKEMKQLHDRKTIRPVFVTDLTAGEKRRALGYLMFLKEKRCGTVKGRGCADGRKQRLYKTKEETSAPTVRTESLLLSCVIDAKEGRQVMTADIPGAFMQVDVDEVVHVRLTGPMAELLTKVDPKLYTKYLVTERGVPVLYCQLQKALYGTLSAALLFWKDLSGRLTEEGYEPNPYDCCVMNKMVRGKQSTVCWHVDDLKISHVEGKANDELLAKLNEWYGKEAEVTVTRGDIHEYLGMTLDFSVKGKVKIRMDDYVETVLEEAPPDMTGRAVTPAASHLFKVNADSEKLDGPAGEMFHSVTAKLLFLCKRARPDIQTPIAFLCTRVTAPDVDDYKKLKRVVCYLRETKTMCLTLEADNLQVIKWWVDASFAVHWDMRSHTGATMSLGKGSIYSGSWRQKLNTRSSTTAELVGVDDAMPMVLWTRQFMEGQGYTIEDNILYQDNMSSILLEKNGQRSSTKRTRHLDIRYFFVTDRIRAKKLTVEYCPTGDMWADVFTKPLQGAAFVKFRKLILNLD